jgi:hypothetical protein
MENLKWSHNFFLFFSKTLLGRRKEKEYIAPEDKRRLEVQTRLDAAGIDKGTPAGRPELITFNIYTISFTIFTRFY